MNIDSARRREPKALVLASSLEAAGGIAHFRRFTMTESRAAAALATQIKM